MIVDKARECKETKYFIRFNKFDVEQTVDNSSVMETSSICKEKYIVLSIKSLVDTKSD